MTVQKVTLADGRTIDIDMDDAAWDTAVAPVTAPAAATGTAPRDDAAWAEMRRKANEGEQATRRLAFLQAGIDPGKDPRHEDFMKVYEGKLETADIVAAAQTRGYLPPPADPTVPPERTPEQAASIAAGSQISAAANGAAGAPTDPEQRLAEAYAAGGTPAMIALAKELGMPVDNQQDYAQSEDAAGWGAGAGR